MLFLHGNAEDLGMSFTFVRHMRDQFKGHENYDLTEEFCRKYDQTAFDPDYVTPDLAHYEPALRRVLAAPKQSVYKAALDE